MPPSKIGGHSVQHLLTVAESTVVKKTTGTRILDPEAEERIPKFDLSELKIGKVLGRGGFCVVSEVSRITLQTNGGGQSHRRASDDDDDDHHFHNVVQNREFMEANCLRGKNKDCRYAVKQVQASSYNDVSTFVNSIVDLAVEARFLAVIRHPNIIKMRATSSASPYSANFFVVLDRLYDTLTQRLAKWRKQKPGGMMKVLDRGGKKEAAFWLERVTVVYDLSCALKFLHDSEVMYRDIKPDNIGFDVRGDVKIFDFGLAREFDSSMADANGNYKLTGETGSPRYMATEVALEQPYNEKCDVFSLSILFWEILMLQTPYAKFTVAMFKKKVVEGGVRPGCDPKWPKEITKLLRAGWGSLATRPSMEEFSNVVRDEVNKYSEEEIFDDGFDASRKSELSFRRGRGSSDLPLSAYSKAFSDSSA